MATSPVSQEFSVGERSLASRALETLRASVVRAAKAEHDPDIAKLRFQEVERIDLLIARFR